MMINLPWSTAINMGPVPGMASPRTTSPAGIAAYRGPTGEIVGHTSVTAGASIAMIEARRFAEITADEARGNSRPVTRPEFQRLAQAGADRMARLQASGSPAAGLDDDDRFAEIVVKSWLAVQAPWGGATWDSHTGEAVEDGADRYAISARSPGVESVRIPEDATEAQFTSAMHEARARFADVLQTTGAALGIFHDDDEHRIDIDPAIVVDSVEAVEQIGAYTHATGGAYHFATGNGFFPPHVAPAPAPEIIPLKVARRISPASSPWLAWWIAEDAA